MQYFIYIESDNWKLKSVQSKEEAVIIQYSLNAQAREGMPSPFNKKRMAENFKNRLTQISTPWIMPGYREWLFDLRLLREAFAELVALDWLRGKIAIEPEFETINLDAPLIAHMKRTGSEWKFPFFNWGGRLFFTIVPELVEKNLVNLDAPVEIQNSLQRFQLDYPKPYKAAFLIMRFRETRAHIEIYEAIGESLGVHGIKALRADERYYHDDLYHNILTYMHGCGFGVAVFERIEEEFFNPNISLEVGYMMALQKPICILKDRTLKTLQTDLMGKLYKEFDPFDARTTINDKLSEWLRDKEFI